MLGWLELMDNIMGTAVCVAFQLGQRISDVYQLRWKDVKCVDQRFLITFRKGKTIPQTGPYTLPLPSTSVAARKLSQHGSGTGATPEGYMFLQGKEWEQEWPSTRVQLKAIIGKDVRCIRRGGLQRLAELGAPTTTLLQFSRHADESMLRRYLQEGASMEAVLSEEEQWVIKAELAQTTQQSSKPTASQ